MGRSFALRPFFHKDARRVRMSLSFERATGYSKVQLRKSFAVSWRSLVTCCLEDPEPMVGKGLTARRLLQRFHSLLIVSALVPAAGSASAQRPVYNSGIVVGGDWL